MTRDSMIDRVATLADAGETVDMLVVGGGATGLGTALDAALRGYSVLLAEGHDFAKGTSSKSTKLIHGGVRYLRQGNLSLVRGSLRERGHLIENAPGLVSPLAFVVPGYKFWDPLYYTTGLKLYDALAGSLSLGTSRYLSHRQTVDRLPSINPINLHGGTLYFDAQFDDARLALATARAAADAGATVANYLKLTALTKSADKINGAVLHDTIADRGYEIRARVVVNATGTFGDHVRQLDDPGARPVLVPSQGIHIVLDRSFLPGETALMIPDTDDGRVLFAITFKNRLLVGTTDTPVNSPSLDPKPLPEEIGYLLEHLGRYLTKQPTHADVRSAFAGLRPLVGNPSAAGGKTSAISRDHTLLTSPSGLVSILGGKWTTFRKMAQDTVDHAAAVAALPARPCTTASHHISAPTRTTQSPSLHPQLPYTEADIVNATRHEMAVTLEDTLARRTRCLLLDVAATLDVAARTADIMAAELGHSKAWTVSQLAKFTAFSRRYLP